MEITGRSRIKGLVRDLYRAFLGREPDTDGARTYEALIRKLGADRAIPKMIKAFLSSREYRERADAATASHVNATLVSQGGDQFVSGMPVGHLVPLGTFCLPSIVFRDAGLRRYSLPFDWIFSTPQMIRDCLADDFTTFLDRRHYQPGDQSSHEPGAEHLLYRERYGLPGLFVHHDPTRERDYLYFVRCVTRFRHLLSSTDAKLFVTIGRPNHDLTNEFPLLVESLSRATTNFALLCVELLDPTERGLSSLVPLARNGEHVLYRFTPSSFNPVGGFLPDKLDEWTLLRLFYRYKLTLRDSPWGGAGSGTPEESSVEEATRVEETQSA
jgi:hypothetical protein